MRTCALALLTLIVTEASGVSASAQSARSDDGASPAALVFGAQTETSTLVPAARVGSPTRTILESRQEITVEDLVGFATIGDPKSLDVEKWINEVGIFSPDGSRIAVVVRRGNVERKTNDGTLLVFQTSALMDDPVPDSVAYFASATNRQPIANVHWLLDNETLLFAGTEGEQLSQIYRVNLRTRRLDQLTRESTPILWFDIIPSRHLLVTVSEAKRHPPAEDVECLARGCRVTADTIWEAERGAPVGSGRLAVHDLVTGKTRVIGNPEEHDPTIKDCEGRLEGGASPDGRFGLRMCINREQPRWWADYVANAELRSMLLNAYRLVLVDFDRDTTSSVSEAPFVSYGAEPIWIDGGSQVILAGALEPLTSVDNRERARRTAGWAILLFNPITGRTERIAELSRQVARVTGAHWDDKTETLILDVQDAEGGPPTALYYRRESGHWSRADEGASTTSHAATAKIQLSVEQSLNDRPILVAMELKTGRKRQLLDPNPWLAYRKLGRVEAITWKARDGRIWKGGLYYPANYQPGVRYPLVMQTHGFKPDRFSLHGYARNFPGQALAAHDIAVLQVSENIKGVIATPAELPTVRAGYEAAVDHLDRLGLVDRNRVGIQGWSRTGPHMGYLLTHSSYSFAAGAFTDTADFGWWWYLSAGTVSELDALFGAAPFGDGIESWLETSPTFNLHRVQTPMLMWASGTGSLLWDWYSGLRHLRKPVEYWTSPDAHHDVFQVGQRLTINQLLVDWFRFWLRDEEDSDLTKSDQYVRWRKFRAQREPEQLTEDIVHTALRP